MQYVSPRNLYRPSFLFYKTNGSSALHYSSLISFPYPRQPYPKKLSCIANNLLSGAVIHSRDKHTFSAYNVTKLASVAVLTQHPKGHQLS